ncbi:HupE / UreJ protein [Paenibacillus sp. UNCCL117]|uniref:HupE/UreJ family protein n=1 Tax=unclassified Paenibacillus TaxID=185978 RepID=UPI0008852E64|nr:MULTISPECIES: HupE/UreJ family protein [unclassified Paenibacillus]SDE49009.1 HupE / UreJ protein [Paenibacillus sp. cl123]SFW66792.1 HupE / UreJ protein [Paenibacillus sp. UNCCL117]
MNLFSAPWLRMCKAATPGRCAERPPFPLLLVRSAMSRSRSRLTACRAATPGGGAGPRLPGRPELAGLPSAPSLGPPVRLLLVLALALTLLVLPLQLLPTASAHPLSVASSELRLQPGSAELVFAVDDLSVIESVPGVDLNGDNGLDAAETEQARDAIAAWLLSNLSLSAANAPLTGQAAAVSLQARGGKRMVVADIRYAVPPDATAFRYADGLYKDDGTTYVDMLVIRSGTHVAEQALSGEWRTASFIADGQGIRLSREEEGQVAGGLPGSNNSGSRSGVVPPDGASSWSSFFMLGIHHILTGYDHLLFLLALLLRKQKLLDYAKIATAFTIAHSLTLTLAVLGWNPLPSRAVEVLIALSIVYVAVENLCDLNRGRRWQLTFVFGLVHGLGFAGILSELDIPPSHLAVSLVSFNLGIEVVQLALIAAASPLLKAFQGSGLYRRGFAFGSTAILTMGMLWAVERLL